MRLFKWSKRNAAYIPEIDAEHRSLYQSGDEFHKAVLSGAGPEQIRSMMQALVSGIEAHFAHEERLMLAAFYPTFAWHKQQHDGVRKRLRQFIEALELGDRDTPLLCAEYLAQWFESHTALTDRMMAAYLRNHRRQLAVAS